MIEQSKDTVSLNNIENGAVIEAVDHVLAECWNDILDPNTEAKSKRKITLTITLTPDEEREMVGVSSQVKVSLPGQRPTVTKVTIGQDQNGAKAHEWKSRQTLMEDVLQNADVTPLRRNDDE